MLDDTQFVTVTDLKQYAYCPRVVYYEQCLPHVRPRTFMMDAGKEAHEDEPKRAARRSINRYELPEGERYFNVRLTSETLGLRGLLDEVVMTPQGDSLPVDYKLATSAGTHHQVQLTAYALLLEANGAPPIEHGFIYLIPLRKVVKVAITAYWRTTTLDILKRIQGMIAHEQMPPPVKRANQCAACEFRRFCNDV